MRTCNIILVFICLVFFSCGISQDVYDNLQAKYNTLNKQNQETVNENKALNDELKLLKAKCGAGEAMMKSSCNDIVVELVSAIGYKDAQRIDFEFKVVNLGPNQPSVVFPSNRAPKMMYNGKVKDTFAVTFAGEKNSGAPLPTNVSVDLQYQAYELLVEKDVVPDLQVWATGSNFKKCIFNFKNIPLEVK